MKRLPIILPLLLVLGISYPINAQEKAEPTTAPMEDRVAQLEAKLEAALQRIDDLEAQVAELKKQGVGGAKANAGGAKNKPQGKPDLLTELVGSEWEGTTSGREPNGQAWGPQAVTAKVISRDGDAFLLRVTVGGGKGPLVYEYKCEPDGKFYRITKCDRVAGDSGIGEGPGPVIISTSTVNVSEKQIVVSFERPKGNGKQNASYRLQRKQ